MNQSLKIPAVPMGGLGVCQGSGGLRTLLGSCLGLVLYERRLKIGGLAHIVLPKAPAEHGDTPGKFVDTAAPALIRMMEERSEQTGLKLYAKLAGGANMFNTSAANSIGDQNIAAMENVLDDLRIPVLGRHLGGEQGRRMTLDVSNGAVTIEIVGAETIVM